LNFKLVNLTSFEEYNIKQGIIYNPDQITGTLSKPVVLEATKEDVLQAKDSKIHFTVLPNPFNEEFKLSLISENEEKLHLKFYNSQGILLQEMDYNMSSGQNILTWEKSFCNKLYPGFYYLKLQYGNHNEVVMLIKN
jgi:hypothetical protein